jgi:putative Mg2+ transporter-C (MgtC) family protein
METCARRGFRVQEVKVCGLPDSTDPAAQWLLRMEGSADAGQLTSELFQNDGVTEVELTATTDDE